jgi:hypothetical protein
MALVGAMLIASPASAGGNNNNSTNNESVTVTVEGDEATKRAAASARVGIARGTCTSNGVGVQTPVFGASANGPDDNCMLLFGAEAFDATGDEDDAEKADVLRGRFYRNIMLETNLFKTLFKMLPIVGGLLP